MGRKRKMWLTACQPHGRFCSSGRRYCRPRHHSCHQNGRPLSGILAFYTAGIQKAKPEKGPRFLPGQPRSFKLLFRALLCCSSAGSFPLKPETLHLLLLLLLPPTSFSLSLSPSPFTSSLGMDTFPPFSSLSSSLTSFDLFSYFFRSPSITPTPRHPRHPLPSSFFPPLSTSLLFLRSRGVLFDTPDPWLVGCLCLFVCFLFFSLSFRSHGSFFSDRRAPWNVAFIIPSRIVILHPKRKSLPSQTSFFVCYPHQNKQHCSLSGSTRPTPPHSTKKPPSRQSLHRDQAFDEKRETGEGQNTARNGGMSSILLFLSLSLFSQGSPALSHPSKQKTKTHHPALGENTFTRLIKILTTVYSVAP